MCVAPLICWTTPLSDKQSNFILVKSLQSAISGFQIMEQSMWKETVAPYPLAPPTNPAYLSSTRFARPPAVVR